MPYAAPHSRQTSPLAGPKSVGVGELTRPLLIFPATFAGRSWHRVPGGLRSGSDETPGRVAGASTGRFPLPLWMSCSVVRRPVSHSAVGALQPFTAHRVVP